MLVIELDMGTDEGLLDKVFPEGVFLRVSGGGLMPTIEVRGPVEGVVKWVNEVYSGGPDNPPILRPNGTWANEENPGMPEGY